MFCTMLQQKIAHNYMHGKVTGTKIIDNRTNFSSTLVAASFRSVPAVCDDYKELVFHSVEAKNNCSSDKRGACMQEGSHIKITSAEFLLDLGLMCDALQECPT
jgi:hypothetical protein